MIDVDGETVRWASENRIIRVVRINIYIYIFIIMFCYYLYHFEQYYLRKAVRSDRRETEREREREGWETNEMCCDLYSFYGDVPITGKNDGEKNHFRHVALKAISVRDVLFCECTYGTCDRRSNENINIHYYDLFTCNY